MGREIFSHRGAPAEIGEIERCSAAEAERSGRAAIGDLDEAGDQIRDVDWLMQATLLSLCRTLTMLMSLIAVP